MLHDKITSFLMAVLLLAFCGTSLSQITILPHGFGVSMEEENAADAELILVNDYEDPVTFSFNYELIENEEERREGPRRDEPGELLNQYDTPLNQVGGMAFDGELLWGSSYGSDQLCAMTLEGEQIMLMNTNNNPLTMTFDGELLWVCEWSTTRIFLYDLEGEAVGQFDTNISQNAGMGSDQEEFVFINSGNDDRIHVFSIDEHEEVTVFDYRDVVNGADIWAIEWVESHRDGQLWCNTTGHLYQLFVDDEWNVELVSDFEWNSDQNYNDPCHDGENMWHGSWNSNTWYQFDDGVAEFFMLTFDPEEGEIPGEDSIPVEVFITSEGIEPGNYNILISMETESEIMEFTAIISVDSPAAFLTCRVSDAETEEIMRNVRIDVDRYEITRFTNRNGITDFESLPTGEYEFSFSADDYLTHLEEYRIDGEGELFLAVDLLHSECNPDRDNIEEALDPDNILQTEITISNDGNGPLTYTTEKRLLGDANSEPWDLRHSINIGEITGDSRIQGVVFIDDLFYFAGANDREPMIHVINRDGEVVNQYPQLGESRYGYKDIAWDGELIWGSGERNIFGFTPEGEEVISFDTGLSPCTNIAWDSEREILWGSGTTTNIFGFDRDGNRVDELQRQGIRMYGLAFWPDDPDGSQLYIFHKINDIGDEIVSKMDTDNSDTTTVIVLEPEGAGVAQGCCITNQYDIYSWVFMACVNNGANDRLEIWQLDARKDWMDIEPPDGVIEAEEEQEFVITLDATGLPQALFEGEIIIKHDGIGGQTPITISLDVGEGGGGNQEGEMNLSFIDGWNIISAHLQPDPDDIIEIMSDLVGAEQLILMKNGQGRFYNPAFNFNNIPGWRVNEGYMVNVDGDAEMTISGIPVNADTPLPLAEGWQIVSYYPRQGIDAIVAFTGVVEVLLMAKDAAGRFYNPEFNFSNMGDLQPGQGYLVNVSEAVELVYTLDDELASTPPDNFDQPHFLPIHANTGENMSMLVLSNNLEGEIGIYSDGNLVGSGVIQDGRCGIAVWGDDQTTPEVDGAVENRPLEFIFADEHGTRQAQIDFIIGSGQYFVDDFQAVRLDEVELMPDEFGIVSAYPNPFNNRTVIQYNLPEACNLKIKVINVLGESVTNLFEGGAEVGMHSIDFNASNLASGIYYVKLNSDKSSSTRKIVLIR